MTIPRVGTGGSSQVKVGGLAVRGGKIKLPKMIAIPGSSFASVMLHELKVGEFRGGLTPGQVAGHNKDVAYLDVSGTLAYIDRVRERTGVVLRHMTGDEWDKMPPKVKAKMTGTNWFRVETSRGSGQFDLRCPSDAGNSLNYKEFHDYFFAVRLAEVKELPCLEKRG